jgi:hypothetical protein
MMHLRRRPRRRFYVRIRVTALLAISAIAPACAPRPVSRVPALPSPPLVAERVALEDTAPKHDLRLVPPEVYLRTYLALFGGLAPLDIQAKARGADRAQLFDAWDDYVSALGLPDYRFDIPRQTRTHALMIATFERLGVALCDRAVEHDLEADVFGTAVPVKDRLIFAWGDPNGDLDAAGFGARFDVLHRTFLGSPSARAPPTREPRFFRLYQEIAANHAKADPRSRFSPAQAGWAAVCYGLVRHPEFHFY